MNTSKAIALPLNLLPAFAKLLVNQQNHTNTISLALLKQAYRKRALETHPDRICITGVDKSASITSFLEITAAYQALCNFVQQANKSGKIVLAETKKNSFLCHFKFKSINHSSSSVNKTTTSSQQRTDKVSSNNNYTTAAKSYKTKHKGGDHYWHGTLPKHQLPIGQYLYYSGVISWHTLVQAIHWQRHQRPRFGEIAEKSGNFSSGTWQSIMQHTRPLEAIGDTAVRLGYLSNAIRNSILAKQRSLQPRIGQYFVEHGVLRYEQLQKATLQQWQHNRIYSQVKSQCYAC